MTIIDGIFLFLIICIGFLQVFLHRHMQRMAELLTERDLAYESEKGKNLATKEDIEDITKQIETVKSEISFEKQRKNDFVEERKRRLLDILYYVEKISYCHNRLMLYVHNYSNPHNLHNLNDEMNATLLDLTHESHIVIAEFKGLKGIETLTKLVDDTALLVAEMVFVSHNVANCIANSLLYNNKAESLSSDKDKALLMGQAMDVLQIAENYANQPIEHKETVQKDIEAYIVWLNQLFGKGLNFKYQLAE